MKKNQRKNNPPSDSTITIMKRVADIGKEKHAFDFSALYVGKISSVTDFFLFMNCKNDRQVKAISDEIVKTIKKEFRLKCFRIDGKPQNEWVVMDYGDLIIHIFLEPLRKIYQLETLWEKGEKIEIE